MKRHMIWLAAAAATLIGGSASAQNYSNDSYRGDYQQNRTTVRCESVRGHRVFCPVHRIERARVSRQLSQRSCVRGRNWNYDNRGIWVSNGCRANFQVSRSSYGNDNRSGYGDRNDNGDRYGNGNGDRYDNGYGSAQGNTEVEHTHVIDSNGQIIHCQSTADGRNYCGDHDSRYIISGNRDSDCIEGDTYGRDDRGTWVSGDCDAQFSVDESYDRNR